jgi:mono/diheme cytochrome c family protein
MTLAGRCVAAALVATGGLGAPAAAAGSEAWARGAFLERCGGCHGLDGKSAAALVPDLRDQVGYFLCTPEGRAYIGRLPNVAFSGVSDQQLAEMVNYTVFQIGGSSAPAKAKPYTAAEVGRLRRRPLTATDLVAQRARVAEAVIRSCPAAEGLRVYKSRTAIKLSEKEAAP